MALDGIPGGLVVKDIERSVLLFIIIKSMPMDHDLEESNFLSVRQKQQLADYVKGDLYVSLNGSEPEKATESNKTGGFRNFLTRWLGV